MENTRSDNAPTSWVRDLMQRTRLIQQIFPPLRLLLSTLACISCRWPVARSVQAENGKRASLRTGEILWNLLVILPTLYVSGRDLR